jgi:DNA repair protein RecO (recombination protein O)
METWRNQAIVLSAKAHGENGAIVSLLTPDYGRHAGYVRGAQSARNRSLLEPGSVVSATWQARVSESLGTFKLEQDYQISASIMNDPLRLGALLSSCALCNRALPEREGNQAIFNGLKALLDTLESEAWSQAYVVWEIGLLRELGFSLDLSRCAGGGNDNDLYYVSPKTGRAVSRAAGDPYKDKLLLLPGFLRSEPEYRTVLTSFEEEVLKGLKMTGYFLENWVFAHHSQGMPEDRLRFEQRFAKTVS